MPGKRKRLNRQNIASNLEEAIEQIRRLHTHASERNLKEEELQVGLLHAYHHLNWASNTRRIPESELKCFTPGQYRKWGKYPTGIEDL